ncbi:hypothetical protein F0562_020128 [Nyssa sinensis]|uniref:Dynamin-type G domain-containing protein n=1 Tax=Nyssa sinensis TaxID=561372 RepID=A0A5J5BRM4_9ASTE|nr:hypothetical protein F0562_020128 [Nyssa sinensis]
MKPIKWVLAPKSQIGLAAINGFFSARKIPIFFLAKFTFGFFQSIDLNRDYSLIHTSGAGGNPLLDGVDKLRYLKVMQEGIQLPTIVVVGDQSSGKSSVLESLAGINLPRGQGICTRVPLIMRLQHQPNPHPELFLEFHGQMVPTDETHIAIAISDATNEIAGYGKGISHTPLTLIVKKNGVPDLTMVDLPRITRVPVHGQPDDIYEQISGIIMETVTSSARTQSLMLNSSRSRKTFPILIEADSLSLPGFPSFPCKFGSSEEEFMDSDDVANSRPHTRSAAVQNPPFTDSKLVMVSVGSMKQEFTRRHVPYGWLHKLAPLEPVLPFTKPLDPEKSEGAGIVPPKDSSIANGESARSYNFHGRIGRGGRIIFDRWNSLTH